MIYLLTIAVIFTAIRARRWVRKNPLEARIASKKFQRGVFNLALIIVGVAYAPLRLMKKSLTQGERSLSVELSLLQEANSPAGRKERLEEILLRR